MQIPITFQLIRKYYFSSPKNPLYGIYAQINLSTSASKTTTVISLLLTFLTCANFSHNSFLNITPTPPIPSPLSDHHRLYLFPFIPNILALCSHHLTTSKQHKSTILFLSSSQASPFQLKLPKFHMHIVMTHIGTQLSKKCQHLINN